MMKFISKLVCIIAIAFISSCATKSSTKGLIILNRCYKLVREHLTEKKPELINLDTLKEWEVCDSNSFNHDETRIKADGDDTVLLCLTDSEENKQFYDCRYELVVDNVGQSGSGYILINDIQYNFYLVDTWALCIEIDGNLTKESNHITLEFQLWGC